MDKFYMMLNGGTYRDIKLPVDNWEDAIEYVKKSANYLSTKRPRTVRLRLALDEYIEVYRGKPRKNLTFEDLENPKVYRRVY
jgi:hypothetical protein